MSFWWPPDYRPDYELRNWDSLVQTVQSTPHGVFWPLLGARRSGKTWALKALVAALGQEAAYVSLDQIDAAKRKLPPSAGTCKYLMLDEPGCLLFDVSSTDDDAQSGRRSNSKSARKFVEWCHDLKNAGIIITLALTPAEWHVLQSVGGAYVNKKDLEYGRLGPLTPQQAQKLPRNAEQSRLLARVPEIWQRNPFLLAEWFRAAFCDNAEYPVEVLESQLIEELNTGKYEYFFRVFRDGLIPEQRETVRQAAQGLPTDPQHRNMLLRLGLLMQPDSAACKIGDPVLADHFPPPLRIHHVSDLHFGRNTEHTVDGKDKSEVGTILTQAAGQQPVRDDYLNWLRQLDSHRRPHIVIVSGDIAEWGLLEELQQGREWLGQVAELLGPHPRLEPDDPRVLLVQGNHDVNRDVTGSARHALFHQVFGGTNWLFPRLDQAAPTRSGAHWHSRRFGIGMALLGSPEYGGIEHEGVGRIDPGLVHDHDIQLLGKASWADQPVRIAVVHHPLAQNPSIATEVAAYSGLTNGGQLQAALEAKQFTLLLHGHTHAAYLEQKGKLLVVGAATLGSRGIHERHGFNEIVVLREGDHFTVNVQIHERKAGTFVPAESKTVEVDLR